MEQAGKEAQKGGREGGRGDGRRHGGAGQGPRRRGRRRQRRQGRRPAHFRDLQASFVDLPGWEKKKPTGESDDRAVQDLDRRGALHEGRRRDPRQDHRLAYNALMLVPFSWVSNMGYEKETETGYEKAVKVAGFPGLEKWNTESKDGELTLVANKRYIVELEGNDVADPKVLHQLAESMSLSKLPSQ